MRKRPGSRSPIRVVYDADEQEGAGYKVHPFGTHIFEGVDIRLIRSDGAAGTCPAASLWSGDRGNAPLPPDPRAAW